MIRMGLAAERLVASSRREIDAIVAAAHGRRQWLLRSAGLYRV
jgi:hypothetical protein